MQMRAIGPMEVQRIYLSRDDPAAGRSPVTLNKERDMLRAFFNWAIGMQIIERNPLTREAWPRKDPKKKGPRSRVHVAIDRPLLDRIIDRAPIRYHRLFLFLFVVGLRISECLAARWIWVQRDPRDPEQWILIVPDAIKQRRGYEIPLGPTCMQILGPRKGDDERIFAEAPSQSAVKRMLNRIGNRLGIKGLSSHQFRRSCSTGLFNAGMPLPEVQAFMGWRTPPQRWLEELRDSYYLGLGSKRAREIQDRLYPPRDQ